MICERHFTTDDFDKKPGKKAKKSLKKGVPSIFDKEPTQLMLEVTPTKKITQLSPNKYCKIKNCPNEIGTKNKEFFFFR